jgi:hypothetical protein
MSRTLRIGVLALTCLMGACSDGPVKRVHPSTASIQQLAVLPDGSWKITLRIQNYSTMAMHYSAFDARLSIADVDAGQIRLAPDVDIVGSNGDVIETILKPSTRLPASGDFAYKLKGTIDTSEPKESFPFERASRLSPIPGVANTYR